MNIENLIEKMSIEEKVGQMCVPILQKAEITKDLICQITERYAGMIRYCPNAEFDNASEVVGEPNTYFTASETAEFLNSVQKLSEQTPNKIPLFIAIDQEGSTRNDVNRAGAFAYSGHMSFGAADDLNLTYEVAKAAGREFSSMGINVVQAPIVDVIKYEGRKTMKVATFGPDVKKVTDHALAMMKGYSDGGVLSMAKHFPGYGSVSVDAHKGISEITKSFEELESEDIAPLVELFKHNLGAIMTGHVITHSIDSEHPATVSEKVIKKYLREKLGFDGIVETDAMRMSAIQQKYGTAKASVMAIKAGCDLVLLRGDFNHYDEGYNAILNAVKSSEISMEEIDTSIRRILKQKNRIGLFENRYKDPEQAKKIVGCKEHREFSKKLAKNSVSLLKSKNLPLARDKKILCVSVIPQKMEATKDNFVSPEMLFNAVKSEFDNAHGMLISLNVSDDEVEQVKQAAKHYDAVIFGCCNAILYENQKEVAKAIFDSGKTAIVVAMESPYDIELMPYIENFICTMGVAPDSMNFAAKVIAGKEKATAMPPVTI